jgi:ABC-2 type transport system ATP-binding protein
MIVQTDNLWKSFGRFGAVRGLGIAVPEGSRFAMLGSNGAGKTTTIKLLMNIIVPSQGTATVLGVDSRRISRGELTRIGYVSENQDMPGRMTVGAYIAYLRPFYPNWDRTLEGEVLRRLRLPTERRIKDLSHGMRLKMALACALPFRPQLLVMDEPLSGLDPLMRDEVMQSLLQWTGETTILISSHELVEVEALATHIAFLDRGSLLFQEATPELANRFREVRVTFDRAAQLPMETPKEWLEPRVEGNVLRFIDMRYSSERELTTRLESQLVNIAHIETSPIPLRSIFTALARALQDGDT